MSRKYSPAIILGIIGVLSLIGSFYIKSQVETGKKQISKAEKQVGFGKQLFSLSPESEEIGETLSSPINKKIDEGKGQVAFYSNLALWLEIGGILCVVVAVASGFLGRRK
jgi:hypothetical protein